MGEDFAGQTARRRCINNLSSNYTNCAIALLALYLSFFFGCCKILQEQIVKSGGRDQDYNR